MQSRIQMLASLFKRDSVLQYGFDLSERDLDDIDLEIRLRKDGHEFGVSSATFYHYYRADFKSFVRYRYFLGKLGVRYLRKYGIWQVRFWPPITRLYWLSLFLARGKLNLIPYIVTDGIAETAGMIKGIFDLVARKHQYANTIRSTRRHQTD